MSAAPAPATTTPTDASTDIRTPGHLDRRGQLLDQLAGPAQRGRLGRLAVADRGLRRRLGRRGDQQGELVAADARRAARRRRTSVPSRSASACSSSSPAAWPRVSLTSRKRLRSSSSSATGVPCSSPRSTASPLGQHRRAVGQAGQRVVHRLVRGDALDDAAARGGRRRRAGRPRARRRTRTSASSSRAPGRVARGSRTRSSPTWMSATDSRRTRVDSSSADEAAARAPRRRSARPTRHRVYRRTTPSGRSTSISTRSAANRRSAPDTPAAATSRSSSRLRSPVPVGERLPGAPLLVGAQPVPVGLLEQPQRRRQQEQPARVVVDERDHDQADDHVADEHQQLVVQRAHERRARAARRA